MPKLTIDNQEIEVPPGTTVLEAARRLGIAIPTLCSWPGLEAATSCMVCVVKVNDSPRLAPSCALKADEGMRVQSQSPEVLEARRSALELLLAEHIGDCMGPCHVVCPAQMNIPAMIRQIRSGRLEQALRTVKERIALPAILGRICHAPCEKACRRGQADSPVAICLLKRLVADTDLARSEPYLPRPAGPSGRRVAIVGAGPAGLSAAWYLLQQGHACTIFDEQDRPGGMLHRVENFRLDPSVLRAEAELVLRLGAVFRGSCRVGRDVSLEQLRCEHDAVLLTTGEASASSGELAAQAAVQALSCNPGQGPVQADRRTYKTALAGVFAAGAAVRPNKHAVFAVGDGYNAAQAVGQALRGAEVTGSPRQFNIALGKLLEGEIDLFLATANPVARAKVAPGQPLTPAQAHDECVRCLHCDCRKADTCALREFSRQHDAKAGHYRNRRVKFSQRIDHPRLVYEGGKCIACGICIRIVDRAGRKPGLSFTGRGFGVQVSVPFGGSLEEAVGDLADPLVAACPTAAWAFKD